MSAVPEKHPQTFKQYVAMIERFQLTAGRTLWFRGAGQSSYSLLPTLYRHKTHRTGPALGRLEHDLMTRFRQRSIPFLTRSLTDDWDMLFFMQHYGIPTRLLDWTENPFIGLYFAVMSSAFKVRYVAGQPRLDFASDAAVWVLDPEKWNTHALRHQQFDRGILTPDDEALQSYKPLTPLKDVNVHPVALYGAHNSPRIVAQRGAFTIFGQSVKGMEQTYDTEDFPANCLTKIVIGRDVLSTMRASVLVNGISESVVFPDLEGLSHEINRTFGFKD